MKLKGYVNPIPTIDHFGTAVEDPKNHTFQNDECVVIITSSSKSWLRDICDKDNAPSEDDPEYIIWLTRSEKEFRKVRRDLNGMWADMMGYSEWKAFSVPVSSYEALYAKLTA